ncbi:hypothetical protein B0I35DRAFT_425949 [Stachybotrys elegans]|uniref:Uncharacterized protein n=1 Tax=Stachybotrys elegans TaxID=80388 RepID=A0A8K0WTW1_9HYPO|nr:hypothetical protein B0I35DRAFT_425949 [Stachybotrys elegans]
MASTSTSTILPHDTKLELGSSSPIDDAVKPTTYVLNGTNIAPEDAPGQPLFRLAWDITSIPQKGSSVAFDNLDHGKPENEETHASGEPQVRRLFYLAHPADAKFRTDVPAYYITSASPEGLGNIGLEANKPRLKKMEFTVVLSPGRTASHKPLFDAQQRQLFSAKPKWAGNAYMWTDAEGREVAHEAGKAPQQKLVVAVPLEPRLRNALVAAWCLRLWHDTAESKEAKRDALERLTPAESVNEYNGKWVKKAGIVGVLGTLGGA